MSEQGVLAFIIGVIFGLVVFGIVDYMEEARITKAKAEDKPEIGDLGERTDEWLNWAKNMDRVDLAS